MDLFAPGYSPEDVPEFHPLLRARELVSAFITLFYGGEEEVLLRLHVLREVGARAESPRWGPEELRSRFSYLDPVKLETVLRRLRQNGLLLYSEDGQYQLSQTGRNAMAAVSSLLRFAAEEDAELGFLTTQLAGMQATGTVTPEILQHLLSRLNELQWSFEQAIVSGSEFRIRAARQKLSSVTRWIEKGTVVLKALLADPDLPPGAARIAQQVGLAQSRMARVDAEFQRTLNKIDTQRVTLGTSGLSSSDVTTWMRTRSSAELANLAAGCLGAIPQAQFLAGGHDLLDKAEAVLSEEARRIEAQTTLPVPEAAPLTETIDEPDLTLLMGLQTRLIAMAETLPLASAVVGGPYHHSAYRLSLLSLLGDVEAQAAGATAAFARLPLTLHVSEEIDPVADSDEVAALSRGELRRTESASVERKP